MIATETFGMGLDSLSECEGGNLLGTIYLTMLNFTASDLFQGIGRVGHGTLLSENTIYRVLLIILWKSQ